MSHDATTHPTPDATPATNGAAADGARDTVRLAAIDIGSNSIRQIVADVAPDGEIRVVDEMKAMPRLGVGVDDTGMLSEASMDAALLALAHMSTLARQL